MRKAHEPSNIRIAVATQRRASGCWVRLTFRSFEAMKEKWCNKGQHHVPVKGFHKDARNGDGLQSRCKDCYAKWKRENDRSAYHKEYQKKHAGKIAAYQESYYSANKIKVITKVKEWCGRNPARRRANQKRFRELHPEEIRFAASLRRMRQRSAKGFFSVIQWLAKCEYWGWCCYLCGTSLTFETAEIEHRKPLSRGGSNWLANLAPACRTCNARKGSKTEAEYRSLMIPH